MVTFRVRILQLTVRQLLNLIILMVDQSFPQPSFLFLLLNHSSSRTPERICMGLDVCSASSRTQPLQTESKLSPGSLNLFREHLRIKSLTLKVFLLLFFKLWDEIMMPCCISHHWFTDWYFPAY